MKRKHDPNSLPMAAKCRRGWNLDLTTIPHDMLELIFLYVDKKDVINVASLDTKYRLHFKPYIFSHTKMTWFDLLEEIEKSKLTLEKNELSLEKSLTGTRDLLKKVDILKRMDFSKSTSTASNVYGS